MAEAIPIFQTELKNKIQSKTSSKVSTDAFLFKSFKFFDLHNNGWLIRNDFFKAIAKCGVIVETHDADHIFAEYGDKEGKVHYRQFIQRLLFKDDVSERENDKMKSSGVSQKPAVGKQDKVSIQNQQANDGHSNLRESKIDHLYNKCQTYAQVLDLIKKTISNDGITCLLSLAVKFKANDTTKTHQININQLSQIITFLSNENAAIIFKQLSKNGNNIDYSILVYDLRGNVEAERTGLIEECFNYLDVKGQGQFEIGYMISRHLSKQQLDAFKRAVELYCHFQGIDDGVFTKDDFQDLLGFISFSHHSNQQFRRFINKAFYEEDSQSVHSSRSNRSRDFQQVATQKKSINQAEQISGNFKKNKEAEEKLQSKAIGQHIQQHEHHQKDNDDNKSVSRYSELDKKEINKNYVNEIQSIILRIKKRLATKGSKGFLVFERAMKNADTNKDKLLNFEQFKQVMKEQRIDITATECNSIFDVFDQKDSGFVNFPQFVYTIRGKLPENRSIFVDRLWNNVKQTEQETNFPKIKHNLNFRGHPDVQNGRKVDEDIWREIQQTIFTIKQLNNVARSDTVTREQFKEYIENLSLSVIDDKLFEAIIFNFWRLDTSSNILDKYAGSRKLFDPTKNGYIMDHHRYIVKGGSVSQNAPFGTSVDPTHYFTQHSKL